MFFHNRCTYHNLTLLNVIRSTHPVFPFSVGCFFSFIAVSPGFLYSCVSLGFLYSCVSPGFLYSCVSLFPLFLCFPLSFFAVSLCMSRLPCPHSCPAANALPCPPWAHLLLLRTLFGSIASAPTPPSPLPRPHTLALGYPLPHVY